MALLSRASPLGPIICFTWKFLQASLQAGVFFNILSSHCRIFVQTEEYHLLAENNSRTVSNASKLGKGVIP